MRTPLLVSAVLRRMRAGRLEAGELCLMDNDGEKLALIAALCRRRVEESGLPLRLSAVTDPRAALSGARHVVASIRPGCEPARILDERIALKHGVLGQETTGPGGFAMALRSIPAILDYARLLEELSPGAWLYNFTNPAGLVTQALTQNGFTRVLGICDSANAARGAVAAWLGLDLRGLRAEVFGLNHLSWTRRVWDVSNPDQDLLRPLLLDPAFQSATLLRLFEPGLLQLLGLHPNEYLFYYYYRDAALRQVMSKEHTRGEQVWEYNRSLLDELRRIDPAANPAAAQAAYQAYLDRRSGSYMPYKPEGSLTTETRSSEGGLTTEARRARSSQEKEASSSLGDLRSFAVKSSTEEGEGYAGVMLDLVEAIETGAPLHTALNIPNAGAIPGMQPDDVVEVSVDVDGGGAHPIPLLSPPPEGPLRLMQSVKYYERLAVEAALTRSRDTAVEALLAHPLVGSYPLALRLVDEYLAAHREYVGEWK